uniref:Uncharacterized protein n=1 Tax=Kalanchoe fedtschenkoi TaxID=63787 RepID=A0A7N0TLH6_KALFE
MSQLAPPPSPLFFLDTLFDLITILLIAAILILSLLSLAFIFHLRLKIRSSPHLHNFNTLWSLRLLLVLSVIFWSISYLLRSSLVLQRLRIFTLPQGIFLCKLHVVLTLGLFEPAFLTTLLFLLNLSIQKRDPSRTLTNIAHILLLCAPVLLFQVFVVFHAPALDILPDFFRRDYVIHTEPASGDESAVCAYPLLSTIVFAAFAVSFLTGFVLSCWRVVSMVINKRLRIRIYALGSTAVAAVVSQVAFMALSVIWLPEKVAFGGAALMVFLAGLSCAVIGEGILVIHPISDALSAGGDVCVLRLGEPLSPASSSSSFVTTR